MNVRRILAVGVALTMGLTTILSGHGGSASSGGSQATTEVDPTISPPSGVTRVRGGNVITFGGTAPADATLVSKRLLSIRPGEEEVIDHQYVPHGLQLQDGVFTGTSTYPGPSTSAAHGGHLVLEVTLDLGEEEADEGVEGEEEELSETGVVVARSNTLEIDLVRPNIAGTSLVQEDLVRVDFSEPVRVKQKTTDGLLTDGIVLDWKVDQYPPLEMRRSDPAKEYNKSWLLKVTGVGRDSLAYDEDDTPKVRYDIPREELPGFVDKAGWPLSTTINVSTTARDRIPPQAPAIQELAGQASKDVVSNDATPAVLMKLNRDDLGHVGQLWLESNGEPGFQVNEDTLLGEAVADSDGVALVELDEESALPDGDHTLYAVARDNAKCNPGTSNPAICPNHSTADTASFTLDTVVPKPLLAQITGENELRVELSEPVIPDGHAGEWVVSTGGAVQSVTGSGNVRVVRTEAPLGHLSSVSWAPNGDTYSDAAGNELAPFTLEATGGLPPVVQVTLPGNKVWTRDMGFPIEGVTNGGPANGGWTTHVQVYRNEDGDWVPVSEVPVASDGSFRRVMSLVADQENRFRLQGLRKNGAIVERLGQLVTVEPIVQDSTPPVVTVEPVGNSLPSGEIGLRGDEPTTIRWTATDANLGFGAITIESSVDGGKTWKTEAAAHNNTGEYGWIAPPNTNTEDAMIRVSARDLAQHKTSEVSNTFIIDSKPPTFMAKTVDATNVKVRFSEPVVANEAPDDLEWTIKTESHPVALPVSKAVAIPAEDVPGMLSGFDLTTGLVTDGPGPLQQQIGPNEFPEVEYTPPADDDLMEQLKDRVGYLIDERLVDAADGIPPLPPTLDGTHSTLVRRSPQAVPGTAAYDLDANGESNIVVGTRTHPNKRNYSADVMENGAFSIAVGLAKNRVNRFFLQVQDPSGNLSEPLEDIRIERDTRKPKVKILKPIQAKRKGKVRFRIRWRSVERNKGNVTIYLRAKGKNKKLRRWNRVALRVPDNGSRLWIAPKRWRGKRVRAMVRVTDAVGNRAQRAHNRWFRIRR